MIPTDQDIIALTHIRLPSNPEKGLDALMQWKQEIISTERKMAISECIEAINNIEPGSGSIGHPQWFRDIDVL
jgi:hypothetical protein